MDIIITLVINFSPHWGFNQWSEYSEYLQKYTKTCEFFITYLVASEANPSLLILWGKREWESGEGERDVKRQKRNRQPVLPFFCWWWQNPLNATSSVPETNTLELVRAGALVCPTFHCVYAWCQWSFFCLKSRLFCSCTYSKDCFGAAVNAKRWVAWLLWQGPQRGYIPAGIPIVYNAINLMFPIPKSNYWISFSI